MISVVVNSLNEGEKLKKCLDSIKGWADEIVVVDMESNDNTREIADFVQAKVFIHKKMDYIEPIRKFAVAKAKEEWVLLLDPDETVPEGLKTRLKRIAVENQGDAVKIPRLNFIMGKKMKHTNFWPDKHIRFFKKVKIEFSDMIHSYPKVDGKIIELPSDENLAIQHYSYDNLKQYWERMERYSDIEANNLFNKGERFSIINFFYKPAYDFTRRFFRHKGFLDGPLGLLLSCLQAYYYVLVEIKLLRLGNK